MTSVFATSNDIDSLSAPLQSRFLIVEIEPYTYEQFCHITEGLLSRQKIEREAGNIIADAVWNKSQDIRDCIKLCTLAKSTKDVEFIVDKFFGTGMKWKPPSMFNF